MEIPHGTTYRQLARIAVVNEDPRMLAMVIDHLQAKAKLTLKQCHTVIDSIMPVSEHVFTRLWEDGR